MNPDPDDIFTHALLEPATQALLARLPKAGETLDCDGGHGEIVNAQALLLHLCEVLSVPLGDLVKTVEALPRWVPAKDVAVGTPYLWVSPNHAGFALGSRGTLTDDDKALWCRHNAYLLIGERLYPKPPKVSP